jgi:hypothetical protein
MPLVHKRKTDCGSKVKQKYHWMMRVVQSGFFKKCLTRFDVVPAELDRMMKLPKYTVAKWIIGEQVPTYDQCNELVMLTRKLWKKRKKLVARATSL